MREDAQPDGFSASVTLRSSVLYPAAASGLKRLLPCIRHRIVEMWNETTSAYETDPKQIGYLIRSAGIARSGEPRGDSTKGGNLLDGWNVDYSNCRTNVTETEIMRLLLGIKPGKRLRA